MATNLLPDTTHRNLTHAAPLYRAVQPWHDRRVAARSADPGTELEVPITAICTRTDGIVPWEACIQPRGPRSESVEVWGSHVSHGHNPLSLAIVADRLALPEDAWEPFHWGPLAPRSRSAGTTTPPPNP